MADVVVPNMTEAAFICGLPFTAPPHSKEYIESLLKAMHCLGPKKVIITGVIFDETSIGSAVFDADSDRVLYKFAKRFQGRYIGTGDLYASVVLASLLNGFDVCMAAEIATNHVSYCIEKTNKINTNDSMAINFEQCTGKLIEVLGI
jgi:pyridoxine kinase